MSQQHENSHNCPNQACPHKPARRPNMGGVAMPAAKLAAMVLAAGLLAGIVPGTVALSCMSPTDVCKASPGMTFITDPCTADCSKFVQCANGVGYLQSCPPGTIFNPAISNCDWPYNVQCKGNTNPPPVPSPSPKASPPPVPSPSPKASPSPSPSPSNGGGAVLYSGTNVGGTYYYDMRTSCNGEQYAENNGYPRCTSTDPAKYQTLAQLGSNNVVAIDNNVLSANLAGLCGKKVLVYRADGSQVAAPDGGDFFVWDGCAACIGGGRLDFSVSGLTNVNPNACTLGVVPGVSFKVVDQVVKPYVP